MSTDRGVLANALHRDPDTFQKPEPAFQYLEPNGDRILVRPTPPEMERAGGKIMLLEAQERPTTGTVISAGPGRYRDTGFEEMPYEAGDLLMYGKFAGQKVELNGEELLVLRLDDVIGLLGEVDE